MARISKSKARKVVKQIKKLPTWVIVTAFILAVIIGVGYYLYINYYKKNEPYVAPKGEISFHFMMLGNKNAGDCVYVRAGENDILIDAGSKENSIDDIANYLTSVNFDGTFEFVIATHAHEDHIAGFTKTDGSIFDLYECGTIIDFPKTDKSETTDKGNRSLYGKYVDERNAEVFAGAIHYNALDCSKNQNGAQRFFDLTEDGNVKLEVLYNYFYDHKAEDENDYSVCVQFHHGSKKFIFTGDLEEEGELKLIDNNSLSQVELYKAGHHGSVSSTCEEFMEVIKPKNCVVCCCAGCAEYTNNISKIFPSQNFINNIAPYTSNVYIPVMMEMDFVDNGSNENDPLDDNYDNTGSVLVMNGNVVIVSDSVDGVYADCSNNNTVLKDTEWFSKYRQMPNAWKASA